MTEARVREIFAELLKEACEDFLRACDEVSTLFADNSADDENYRRRLHDAWGVKCMNQGIVIGLERALNALTKGGE